MQNRKRRQFGSKINFRTLSCAPINEHGVIYLFGVLQDVLDYKVESIQAGFPDCIARRSIGNGRWEEVRIEFEFDSISFVHHKHDPSGVDIIVCWHHNWKDCPEHIEVIELSSMIGQIEEIKEEIKKPKQLSAYNRFSQEKRLEGHTFTEIANLWRNKNQFNKKSFMEEMEVEVGKSKADIVRKLLSWANDMQLEAEWCKNTRARGHLFLHSNNTKYKIFSVATEAGGVIWNWFSDYSNYPPFDLEEKRRDFLKQLQSIEGISMAKKPTINRNLHITLHSLGNESTFKGFVKSYEWFINEIKKFRED